MTYGGFVFRFDHWNWDFLSVVKTCDPFVVSWSHHIFIVILIMPAGHWQTRFMCDYCVFFLITESNHGRIRMTRCWSIFNNKILSVVLLFHHFIDAFECLLRLVLLKECLFLHSSELFALLTIGRLWKLLGISDTLCVSSTVLRLIIFKVEDLSPRLSNRLGGTIDTLDIMAVDLGLRRVRGEVFKLIFVLCRLLLADKVTVPFLLTTLCQDGHVVD